MKGLILHKDQMKEKGEDKLIQVFFDILNNRRIINKVIKEYKNDKVERVLLSTHTEWFDEKEGNVFFQGERFRRGGYKPFGGEILFYTRDLGFSTPGEDLSKYDIELLNKDKKFTTMRTETHLLELSFREGYNYWELSKMDLNTHEIHSIRWHVYTPFLLDLILAEYLSHLDVITRLDSERDFHNETDWYNVPDYANNFLFTREIKSNIKEYINSIHPDNFSQDISFYPAFNKEEVMLPTKLIEDLKVSELYKRNLISIHTMGGKLVGYYDLTDISNGVLEIYNGNKDHRLCRIEITKGSKEKDIKRFLKESCKLLSVEISDILEEYLMKKIKDNLPEEDTFSTLHMYIDMPVLENARFRNHTIFNTYIGETNDFLEIDVISDNEYRFEL